MSEAPLSRTPLYEKHVDAGAKLVDFHGFELPIWYSSIQEEHLATRSSAGIFDVSHMGFLRFSGQGVLSWLSSLSTQDFTRFQPNRCGYTHFLDEQGMIIDDMIFAVASESEVFGVPNSYIAGEMLLWLEKHLPEDNSISIADLSVDTAIISVQGPNSMHLVRRTLGEGNCVGRFRCKEIGANELGIQGWIQGTGYTGERGVEIFVDNSSSKLLWDGIISAGPSEVSPVGLGARDTLRLEMGYLLSGQDFLWPGLGNDNSDEKKHSLSRNTVETAVPFGLEISHDFIGKQRTEYLLDKGQRWTGLVCKDRGPSPRSGHEVFSSGDEGAKMLGFVTSGAPSPSLGMQGIAMAYLDQLDLPDEVWIQTSGRRRIRAAVKKPPFV